MYLLAASYLGLVAVTVYAEFRGSEDPGIGFPTLLAYGPATATTIAPDSPAARAGVQPGDRVVAFEGRPVTNALAW